MKLLRILIADDHDLMRHGIKNMLQARPDWEICGEAHNGDEAIALTRDLKPDIAILDINMPNLNGLEAAKKIGKESPNTEVLILSLYSSDELPREIIRVGVGHRNSRMSQAIFYSLRRRLDALQLQRWSTRRAE